MRGGDLSKEEDDAEGELLDPTRHAEQTSRGGARASKHAARIHGVPGRWSPREPWHPVLPSRPNHVQSVVLPRNSPREVMARRNALWLDVNDLLKLAVANCCMIL